MAERNLIDLNSPDRVAEIVTDLHGDAAWENFIQGRPIDEDPSVLHKVRAVRRAADLGLWLDPESLDFVDENGQPMLVPDGELRMFYTGLGETPKYLAGPVYDERSFIRED